MNPKEFKDLREYLEGCATQYVAAYPLSTDDGLTFMLTVSNTICLAQVVEPEHPSNEDEAAYQRALQKTPQSSRLNHAEPFKSLSALQGEKYEDLVKYRNVGHLVLYRLAKALQSEGVTVPWMAACFAEEERRQRRAKGVQGLACELKPSNWQAMLDAIFSRPKNIVTRDIQLRIIRTLHKRDNALTRAKRLFTRSIDPVYYVAYIGQTNKTLEGAKLPFRILVPPSDQIKETGKFETQLVFVETKT